MNENWCLNNNIEFGFSSTTITNKWNAEKIWKTQLTMSVIQWLLAVLSSKAINSHRLFSKQCHSFRKLKMEMKRKKKVKQMWNSSTDPVECVLFLQKLRTVIEIRNIDEKNSSSFTHVWVVKKKWIRKQYSWNKY